MKTLLLDYRGFVAWTAALALGGNLLAQNFENVAPKQPAPTGPGHVVNENKPKALTAHDETEVLVPKLKGIFLLPDAKDVRTQGVTSGATVVPGQVTLARRGDDL